MAESTLTASALTAEQVQHILIQPLEAQSVFLAAGPRIFDTNGSQVRIPKLGGPTAPGWIGENTQIPSVDVSFDEIVLLPSTMQSVKTLTRFSNELARQSVVNLTTALQTRLVRDVATTIDTALIAGAGDGITTPKGLLNYAGVQTVNVAGTLSLDNLLDAWGLALAANVTMANLRFFLTPGTFTGLRKIKTTTGEYVLQADPTADGVFRVWGVPVTVTPRIPITGTTSKVTQAVLADFGQIAVARDLAPSVVVLSETFADFDQLALRVVARYDAAPMNAQAVVRLDGIAA
ncbi:MAG: phage major capsid protein [Nocardioidaceae bacterium]